MDAKTLKRYVFITLGISVLFLFLVFLFYSIAPVEFAFKIVLPISVYIIPLWLYGLNTGVEKFAPQTDAKTQRVSLLVINLLVLMFQPLLWVILFYSFTEASLQLVTVAFPMLAYMFLVMISYVIYYRMHIRFFLFVKNVLMTVYVLYMVILILSMMNSSI